MKPLDFKSFVAQRESLQDGLNVIDKEVWYTFARSGGPGGQNVNKVNSKAILWWPVVSSVIWNGDIDSMVRFKKLYGNKINKEGIFVLSCQDQRDQSSNKMECLNKLKLMLQQSLTAPIERIPSKPTMGSNERRIFDKMANKRTKQGRNLPSDFE